jgi:hypothetical protein
LGWSTSAATPDVMLQCRCRRCKIALSKWLDASGTPPARRDSRAAGHGPNPKPTPPDHSTALSSGIPAIPDVIEHPYHSDKNALLKPLKAKERHEGIGAIFIAAPFPLLQA